MLEKSDIKKAYLWQHRQSMDDRPKIAPSNFYKQLQLQNEYTKRWYMKSFCD